MICAAEWNAARKTVCDGVRKTFWGVARAPARDVAWTPADAVWDGVREKRIEYLRDILRNGGCDE